MYIANITQTFGESSEEMDMWHETTKTSKFRKQKQQNSFQMALFLSK